MHLYAKIAAAVVAAVFVCLAITFLWAPQKDLWSVLLMAHKIYLAGKLGLIVGIAIIGGASWLWFKFTKRPSAIT